MDTDASIDVSTLDAGDVRVVGGKDFDQPATLIDVRNEGQVAVATYAVTTTDGGAWEPADKGVYTVITNADAVQDTQGLPVASEEIARFKLAVAKAPKAPPPDKAPFVKKLKFAGKGASSISATFSEDVSATIDASDLVLLAEDGSRAVDPSLVTVTYNAKKNIATWTFTGLPEGSLPKGNYRVVLSSGGITDAIGQNARRQPRRHDGRRFCTAEIIQSLNALP